MSEFQEWTSCEMYGHLYRDQMHPEVAPGFPNPDYTEEHTR